MGRTRGRLRICCPFSGDHDERGFRICLAVTPTTDTVRSTAPIRISHGTPRTVTSLRWEASCPTGDWSWGASALGAWAAGEGASRSVAFPPGVPDAGGGDAA